MAERNFEVIVNYDYDEVTKSNEQERALQKRYLSLTPRQNKVYDLGCRLRLPLSAIAEEIGYSVSTVRRLKKQAIDIIDSRISSVLKNGT